MFITDTAKNDLLAVTELLFFLDKQSEAGLFLSDRTEKKTPSHRITVLLRRTELSGYVYNRHCKKKIARSYRTAVLLRQTELRGFVYNRQCN